MSHFATKCDLQSKLQTNQYQLVVPMKIEVVRPLRRNLRQPWCQWINMVAGVVQTVTNVPTLILRGQMTGRTSFHGKVCNQGAQDSRDLFSLFIHVYVNVCINICIGIRIYMFTCVYIYLHIYIYVYSGMGGAYTKPFHTPKCRLTVRVPWQGADLFGGSFLTRVLSVVILVSTSWGVDWSVGPVSFWEKGLRKKGQRQQNCHGGAEELWQTAGAEGRWDNPCSEPPEATFGERMDWELHEFEFVPPAHGSWPADGVRMLWWQRWRSGHGLCGVGVLG